MGMIQAGHKVVWANDNDPDCVQTYRKNISTSIVETDIVNVGIRQIPSGDVVIGGFPCQGFSLANLRRKTADKRNKLYVYFLEVLRVKRPKWFLAENVRGILSLGHGKVMKRILDDFGKAGYSVTYRVFNMADYGVPQTRIRVIIAGTRSDLPEEMAFRFPESTHSNEPDLRALPRWITVSEALEGIPEPGTLGVTLPNLEYSKYKVTDRNFTGHRRTDPDKPSPTILARGDGKGGVCAIQHPGNHRRMSVRECATVQTFPSSFEFIGRMNSCYRQVGNAVPVLFARRLGEQLRLLEAVMQVRA